MSETALSAIAEINPRIRIPKEITGDDQVSFIPMGDVSESGDWITRQTRPLRSVAAGFTAFEEGDVLVAKITPCFENGKGAHAQGLRNSIGFGSTEFHVLRARQGVHPRFVFHVTQSRGFRQSAERRMVGSAGQQRVQRQFFDEFLVKDFSQGEQRAIVQILDTLDTAIRDTGALIDKLKAVKQGLLYDLLTRGIDANGQLRPPQRDEPQLYKESPLGWVPREWECREFSVLAEYLNGNTFDAAEWKESGFPIIRIQNLNGSRDFNYYAGAIQEKWHVHPGDLLFAWSGQRGVSFGARLWDGPEGVLNQHIFRVLPKLSLVSKMFLFRLLRFRQMNIEDAAHGFKDSFLHVTRGELGSVNAGVPSLDEQERIELRIATYESKLLAEEAELGKLQSMKSGLMDDLLTGRVRVTPLLESVPVAPIDQQSVRQMGA